MRRALYAGDGATPAGAAVRRPARAAGDRQADAVRQLGASSLHITFLPEARMARLAGEAGYLLRTDRQFHWRNDGYRDFEDFLSRLSSAKRKNLRKERASVRDAGVEFEHLTGRALTEAHWDQFFEFYMDTGGRKWGTPYLTRDFFSRIGATLANQILLVMAKRRTAAISRARSICSAAASCSAAIGGRWNICPFCILRPAIIRRSISPSPSGSETGRGRSAGRTQIGARLCAGRDPQRPLHRPSRAGAGGG